MLLGFQLSQALYVVAELDVPTLLVSGPRTVEDLAAATGADTDKLRRIIRYLEMVGVFQVEDDTVQITELGATLADGTPGSVRSSARYFMGTHYGPYSDLLHTVRTGAPAADHFLGKPFFDWITEDPKRAELQNAAMSSTDFREAALADYRLPGDGTVADIGGADGTNLLRLLGHQPGRNGIVFDLPAVVMQAQKKAAAAGLADRVSVVGGDFFNSVPTADVYLMCSILHDWDDEKSIKILRSIAKAAPPKARLVLLEQVVPEGNTPHLSKVVDIIMMIFGGRERTASDWLKLLQAGGFTLDRFVQNATPFSFIEATLQ
ncbi:methyltransferase [Streptomyces sp. NPDC052727]|uniref:methyltransferase n=1 Tax=Streptomyces sp. NPDC052727 TaxID=3154854 RepID=UPI003419C2F2